MIGSKICPLRKVAHPKTKYYRERQLIMRTVVLRVWVDSASGQHEYSSVQFSYHI